MVQIISCTNQGKLLYKRSQSGSTNENQSNIKTKIWENEMPYKCECGAGIIILINLFFLTVVKFGIQEYSFGRVFISEYSWNDTWGYHWVMNEDLVSRLLDITVPRHLAICVWRIIITLGTSGW